MPWNPGPGRKDCRAVMFAKGTQLRVELRIEPVGLQHRGLQVIEDERGGDASEVAEGVFQACLLYTSRCV